MAQLVDFVTDQGGRDRRERQKVTYARLRYDADGRKLKLADRITNVEASLRANGASLFGMYRKEYDFFRSMLYREGEHTAMWAHLDALMGWNGAHV